MNYIKHLTGFFHRVHTARNLNPTHISLYLALFQCWNINRFNNPTSISRDEIMKASKINSKVTYHKCIKELHNFGFLEYLPTYNPHSGSYVNMVNLADEIKPQPKKSAFTRSNIDQYNVLVDGQVDDQVYIYNKKQTYKNKTNIDIYQNSDNGAVHKLSPSNNGPELKEKKSSSKKKESSAAQIPTIELVDHYFHTQQSSEIEAKRFFNYYASTGWLVGGKTKMKDWKAAARNWILNQDKFRPQSTPAPLRPENLNTQTNKNYAEPL